MRTKTAEGQSPRSVGIIHATLRSALGDALRLGEVQRNVAALVRPPRNTAKAPRPFTLDEARTFLQAVRGNRLEALYVLAVTTGLRQAELLGLRWTDLDLEGATLTVSHTLQRLEGAYRLVEPKTRRSRRTLALPELATCALRTHRVRQAEEKLAVGKGWNDLDLVFTSLKGRPLNATVLYRDFKRILTGAGLPSVRFHDLRHGCATLLLLQGVHPRLVMEQLGHSAIGVTMDCYSHVLSELREEPAAQMDALLGGCSSG